MDQHAPLRILSLDGGGIRGISSLYIIRELMAQIERERRATIQPPPTARLRPCNVFDLICGTSTGGLIAILLGRLQMVSRLPDATANTFQTIDQSYCEIRELRRDCIFVAF